MPPRDPAVLFNAARRAMRTSQKDLAAALGASERSGQRWAAGGFSTFYLPRLARLVYPHDEALAREIAEAAGGTLESLGIVVPPPPAPQGPPPPPAGIVDAVVCAAAEAIDLTPKAVRPAVLAAFTRAQELGLGIDFVRATLGANKTGKKAPT